LFEAKTAETTDGAVSAREVRQALTHRDWVKVNLGWPEPSETLTVIVTPRTSVASDAASIARDVAMTTPETIQKLAASTVDALRDARARGRGQSEEQLAGIVASGFSKRGLSTQRLVSRLGRRLVRDG
jgi:hypothetical protein